MQFFPRFNRQLKIIIYRDKIVICRRHDEDGPWDPLHNFYKQSAPPFDGNRKSFVSGYIIKALAQEFEQGYWVAEIENLDYEDSDDDEIPLYKIT